MLTRLHLFAILIITLIKLSSSLHDVSETDNVNDDTLIIPMTDDGKFDLSSMNEHQRQDLINLAREILDANDKIEEEKTRGRGEVMAKSASSGLNKSSAKSYDIFDETEEEEEERWKHGLRSNSNRDLHYYGRGYYGGRARRHGYYYNNNARARNYGTYYNGKGSPGKGAPVRNTPYTYRPIIIYLPSPNNGGGSGGTVGSGETGNNNDDNDGGDDDGGSSGAETGPITYYYGERTCPAGQTGLTCPPEDLGSKCDKYNLEGDLASFKSCYESCKPAYCCIHNAQNNQFASPCREDENCPLYAYCYIVWWKLADTIGPAVYLRMEQNEEFYEETVDELEGDLNTNDPFFRQLLLHYFDDFNPTGTFAAKTVFDNPDYWPDAKEGGAFVTVDTSTWPANVFA